MAPASCATSRHNLGVRLAGRVCWSSAPVAGARAMLPCCWETGRLVVANRTVDKTERLAATFARLLAVR